MRIKTFIAIFIVAVSCKSNQESMSDIGLDYFPLKVGAYQIYSVDETQINQSIEQKSVYELKILVADSFINTEGGYSYTFQRQKRNIGDLAWSNLDAWTTRISNRQAIVKEGNTSFVNLTFPAVNGLKWDGNEYNTLGGEQTCGDNNDRPCDTYLIENLGKQFVLPTGVAFDETLIVVQNDNSDLIVKQDVRKEVYAKSVGLIYKENVVLEYCTTSSCLGQQKVNNGIRYKQVMTEYGVE